MDLEQRHRITRKVTLVGAFTNTALSLAQIICGLIGQSQALLADGIHTLADLSSDFVVLFAASKASLAADEDHPYGHGRIETLASLLLGVLLIGVGLSLGIRGWFSIFVADKPDPELITVFFAGLAIVSKEFLYRYTIKAARQLHSSLLEANAMHHRSDVFSSIVVVVGISAQLMGIPHMDALASIIVGILIAIMGYRLSRNSLDELIDSSLDQNLVQDIKSIISSHDEVKAIHSLRTRSMGGLGYVDAEILVNPRLTVSEAHHIAFSLEEQIKLDFPRVIDISIHIDPMTEGEHEAVNHLPSRHELLEKLQIAWESLPVHHEIEQINLHYLDQLIEIDIVLPLAFSHESHRVEIDRFVASTSELANIGRVSIYFRQ